MDERIGTQPQQRGVEAVGAGATRRVGRSTVLAGQVAVGSGEVEPWQAVPVLVNPRVRIARAVERRVGFGEEDAA